MVRDIQPTTDGSNPPRDLVALKGALYFTAHDGEHGRELWKSKGTRTTTRLVKDIRTGTKGAGPRELTRVGRSLFFSAGNALGRELWVHEP